MTAVDQSLLDFGSGLNLVRAERSLALLQAPLEEGTPITLDLRRCRHIDAGASWRLGNVLRPLAQHHPIVVLLAEGSQPDTRAWFRFFTHSGLGFTIARYASQLLAGQRDITEAVRDYYSTPRAAAKLPIDAWSSSTFLYVPDLLRGDLSPDDPADFNLTLRELLVTSPFVVRAYSNQSVGGLFRLLYEAVQNVWDHADKHPLPQPTEVFSSLAIRYFNRINPPKDMTGEFRAFLERASKLPQDNHEAEGFIEVVVADDGVGVAARHSQDAVVYTGAFEREVEALALAFSAGSSVKLQLQDSTYRGSPGFGFSKIADALRELTAFALIRTGRVLAFFDPTLAYDTFVPLEAPLEYLPGTVLQVVFPRRLARVWSLGDGD